MQILCKIGSILHIVNFFLRAMTLKKKSRLWAEYVLWVTSLWLLVYKVLLQKRPPHSLLMISTRNLVCPLRKTSPNECDFKEAQCKLCGYSVPDPSPEAHFGNKGPSWSKQAQQAWEAGTTSELLDHFPLLECMYLSKALSRKEERRRLFSVCSRLRMPWIKHVSTRIHF